MKVLGYRQLCEETKTHEGKGDLAERHWIVHLGERRVPPGQTAVETGNRRGSLVPGRQDEKGARGRKQPSPTSPLTRRGTGAVSSGVYGSLGASSTSISGGCQEIAPGWASSGLMPSQDSPSDQQSLPEGGC